MEGAGKGFTLVEIMVAVAVIGLLASIAVPSFRKVQLNSSAARVMNDLRVYSGAFQRFNLEFGYWPEPQPAGTLPAEMDGYINRQSFELRNSLRCQWKWEVFDHVVGIGMEPPLATLPVLELVDERFDDGSLASGRLRIQSGSFSAASGGNAGKGGGKGGGGPSLPDNASDTAHSVIAKIFAGKGAAGGGESGGGGVGEAPPEGTGFIYIVDVNF